MSSFAALKRISVIGAEVEALLAEPLDALSTAERTAAAYAWERLGRRLPAMTHRLVAALAEVPTAELGQSSLAAALSTLLRISKTEAHRRIREAEDLGPRAAMTGQELEPVLPHTAAAQQRGEIGAEHVRIIRRFHDQLPNFVDFDTRKAAEAQLAELACGLKPEELRQAADRLAILLDQDDELSDADRARRRYLTIDRQHPDGMSDIRGRLDPEARATIEAVFAKWAAPGMCNPEEDNPCIDGDPLPEVVSGDCRSAGQRNHDALKAMGRAILASGQAGSHNGLPVSIVVSTTLRELESGTGHAVTGGGSVLPMSEVIRQASAAHHYLVVFDDHTELPLYLGRSKRLASTAQRIVLYARDRGCTRPGCTEPAYHSQAHHDGGWAAADNPTDIDKMSLACGPDNRLIEQTGWTTRKRKDGRTEWIPPQNLDTGQARVNNYHHPERYLIPDEGNPADTDQGEGDP